MIARILKILLALQLLAVAGLWYAARTVWQVARPEAALLLALGLLLLFRLLIVGHHFWHSWRARSATPAQHRLGPAQRCRLFLDECAASLRASSWDMVWPGPAWHIAPRAQGLPVLLLHGYGCNGGYFAELSRKLAQAGVSHHAPDLAPAPQAGIDEHVPLVRAALAELCERSGSAQAIIVAHSMGGLVARAYLREHGGDRVAAVITLGTPHHGTALASFGYGLNAQQMCRAGAAAAARPSAWLGALAESEDGARRALFTSIFSHHDNIVAPQTSAYLPGAKNIEFGGVGHVALGRDARVLRCVLDEVAAVSKAAPAARRA